MRDIATHSSLDNNDMKQDTNRGHCTTHYTNFLIFQPNPPIEGAVISNSEFSYDEQGTDVDYKIGKLVPPPLISEYEDNESGTLIRHCFAKDVLWWITQRQ